MTGGTFGPGDRVHVAGLGTGVLRELRGGRRAAVEIKGRLVVVDSSALERAEPPVRRASLRTSALASRNNAPSEPPSRAANRRTPSLDLHGKTVPEALDALESFINVALLDGCAEALVVHGRSGGKVKAAVHQSLRRMSTVRSFAVDGRNPGVTIVTFA
jgi:dsDNA-specific endonuclease/ATPase MutS2